MYIVALLTHVFIYLSARLSTKCYIKDGLLAKKPSKFKDFLTNLGEQGSGSSAWESGTAVAVVEGNGISWTYSVRWAYQNSSQVKPLQKQHYAEENVGGRRTKTK